MSDHDALLAAICAEPDEDTLRLAYADWLDEHERSEQAAFVRGQIELARTLPWEPFAVRSRWRSPELLTGRRFRDTLPPVDNHQVEWHERPFRRGLGECLNLRSLVAWSQTEGRVLGRAPISELHLWSATLDDWLGFADSPVVPGLRRLHFVTSPIEPLRVLRDRPTARGITDIHFQTAAGAGMPVVVEDLLRSPLGEVVRGLHFHVGYESLDDLIAALHLRPGLERLSFSVMGLASEQVRQLCDGPALSRLTELSLADEPCGNDGVRWLAGALPSSLISLRLCAVGTQAAGLEGLARSDKLANLRRLDLSRNQLAPKAAKVLADSRAFTGLRSLDLHACRIGDKGVRRLTRAKFWPNLVELDLRGNVLSTAGVKQLLDAEIGRDLTALVFEMNELSFEMENELRKKYGERVVFWPPY